MASKSGVALASSGATANSCALIGGPCYACRRAPCYAHRHAVPVRLPEMLDMAPQFNDIPTIPKAKSRRRSVSICGARASGAGAGAPRATAGKEPPMLEMSRRADFSEIPIVDIGALGGGGSAESAVVAAIRDAAENVGFFYAANH